MNPFVIAPLQDVGVGAELAFVRVKQRGAAGRAGRGLEVEQFQLAVSFRGYNDFCGLKVTIAV